MWSERVNPLTAWSEGPFGDRGEVPGLYLRPDGGIARRDIQYARNPARSASSLLWEVAALGRGWVRERALCLSGGEMQEHIRQGRQGSKGRTYSTICGMVSVFQGSACLVSFLAIGEPRGAGAGEGAASLVGVFSLGGVGLALCEDRWPRPLLGGRRPRSNFYS
jgi:hypothetical protein